MFRKRVFYFTKNAGDYQFLRGLIRRCDRRRSRNTMNLDSSRTRAPAENARSGQNDSTFGSFLAGNMGITGRTGQGKRIEPACSASGSYSGVDASGRIALLFRYIISGKTSNPSLDRASLSFTSKQTAWCPLGSFSAQTTAAAS
jgi:hypothetical protein